MRAATWWIDRWRKSTAYTDMTLAQQGAYRNLLDECWLRPGGIIPSDERILARIAGCAPQEWAEIRGAILPRFRAVEGGLVNDTALAVISQAEARLAAKSAGGHSRWDSMTEDERRAFVASGVASRNKQNKQTDKQDDKQPDKDCDKQSNKPPVSGLRSPGSVLRDPVSDPQIESFGLLSACADEPVLSPVKAEPKRKELPPLIALWNRIAAEAKLPRVTAYTPDRQRQVRNALADEPDLAVWERAFRAITQSRFHRGGGESGWKANFTYAMRPAHRATWLDEARNNAATSVDPSPMTPEEREADAAARRERTRKIMGG